MALNEREFQQYVTLSRQVALQYGIDNYTDEQLVAIRKMLSNSTKEITRELNARIATSTLTEWRADRAGAILNEAERLTAGIQTRLTNDIASSATSAGLEALKEHNSILSWSGMVGGFTNVSLSSSQIRSFMVDTPIHGHTLRNWVDRAFTREIQTKIREEIAAGVFQGKGYRDLVKRVEQAFDNITRREAVTLTRSFVQAANVNAMKAVYDENSDIVEKVKWSAVLENGYRSSGRGTCLICAGLDGNIYPKNNHPLCPIHPRCRCTLLPVTKTFKELGLNINEVEQVHRPYTIRQNKNIDAGGRRRIREVGQHQGSYADWYETRSPRTQMNIVGPNRKRMIDRGDIDFKDLVDPMTGRVLTLQELDAGVMVRPPPGAPGSSIPTDSWGFKQGTKSNLLAEELLYKPMSSKEIKALEWNTHNHDFPPVRAKLKKQGVLFKDGNGRFYTIKPEDIDDHAKLGLKGLIDKKGGGGRPKPLPPDPAPVKPDADKIKKQVRKAANFKAGSKSEQLLEGLMDRPMTGKEIKEFMDSTHDFPAVRKKLVDLDIIAKNKEGKWFVKALEETGPSPPPPTPKPKSEPKPKPKPEPKKPKKPTGKKTKEYWEKQIEEENWAIQDLSLEMSRVKRAEAKIDWDDPDPLLEEALEEAIARTSTFRRFGQDMFYDVFKEADLEVANKILKKFNKILDAQVEIYRLSTPAQRRKLREEAVSKVLRGKQAPDTAGYGSAKYRKVTDEMVQKATDGTIGMSYRQLIDLERVGLKIEVHDFQWGKDRYGNWIKERRGYFSPMDNKIVVYDISEVSTYAHEIGHAADSLMAGKGLQLDSRFGHWKTNFYTKTSEAKKYKKWYDQPKTGGQGKYNNGDGKYWYGNWVNDYEGRIYGSVSRGFAQQYWAMSSQRWHQSVQYYQKSLAQKKITGESIDDALEAARTRFRDIENRYYDGVMSRQQFHEAEKKFEDEIRGIRNAASKPAGQAKVEYSLEEKKILWEQALSRGWGANRHRYPEFSDWFENTYMKKQGISLETDFDG